MHRKTEHLFIIVQEARKSKIKLPADSMSGESPLPGIDSCLLAMSHMAQGVRELSIRH